MSQQLSRLLVELFVTEAKFRRWLQEFDLHLAADVKEGSLSQSAHEASVLFTSHGYVDAALFERLAKTFPRRHKEIWHVAAGLRVERPKSKPPPPPVDLDSSLLAEEDRAPPRLPIVTPHPRPNPSVSPAASVAPVVVSPPPRPLPGREAPVVPPRGGSVPRPLSRPVSGAPSAWVPMSLCMVSAVVSTASLPFDIAEDGAAATHEKISGAMIVSQVMTPGLAFALCVGMMLWTCGLLRPRAVALALVALAWPVAVVLAIVPLMAPVASIIGATIVRGATGLCCGARPRGGWLLLIAVGVVSGALVYVLAGPHVRLVGFTLFALWQVGIGMILWQHVLVPARSRPSQ